ncbi:LysM peptidoglycan-binding domain-containing protein [Aquibacillus halophilus]|uniref:LysM peptidoglycan-binding domain-containing protein n=1 Tax=Aquibacillus halophilus TaxID=930132 RepID=A0A6A8DA67_9BACI|nr:M14 family metallopeptidase [Aquibacillus halophilus]MRH42478.1 LysM peptidoglycan-binding domain-containing protein [Aquibacillus halophilus]
MQISVRQGDSFWYYSQLYQLPLQLINDSNRQINPNNLSVGQSVQIPGFTQSNYEISSGETIWSIARQRNLSAEAIMLVNQGLDPNQLQVGQIIRVPVRVNWRVVNGNEEYNYEKLIEDLRELASIYPFIITQVIGNSVMGKEIHELRIGNGAKKVHVNGSFHGNEWITTPVLTRFLNDYLLGLTNNGSISNVNLNPLYQNTMLSMVPMVNPDGVNLVIQGPPPEEPYQSNVVEMNNGSLDFSNWKANIRGVDLNNQYPAKWEIEKERKPDSPGPRDFPGPYPLSEPEAQAMADLTRIRDFRRVNAFHTQGQVIYWGFENQEPPEARTIVNEYANVSGYQPIRTVDSFAGYKDWFIQEWNRPGYTIELGSGTNPLPLSQFNQIYRSARSILLANLYM